MPKKVVYMPVEVFRLVKMFAVNKSMGEVVRDAVMEMIEKGGVGEIFDVPLSGENHRVDVDEATHYLINRLKVELDYKSMGDFLYDAIVSYAMRRGLDDYCLRRIFNL